jgi:bacterioferritin-associated ferredoxin
LAAKTLPIDPESALIVCHCEAVNDKTVQAAVLSGAQDVASVGDRCKAGINCGGCHRMLERLLHEHITPARAAVAVA